MTVPATAVSSYPEIPNAYRNPVVPLFRSHRKTHLVSNWTRVRLRLAGIIECWLELDYLGFRVETSKVLTPIVWPAQSKRAVYDRMSGNAIGRALLGVARVDYHEAYQRLAVCGHSCVRNAGIEVDSVSLFHD